MHGTELGSAVSPIMTMPHFALILEITPLKQIQQRAHLLSIEHWPKQRRVFAVAANHENDMFLERLVMGLADCLRI